jgi:hypothetical protein
MPEVQPECGGVHESGREDDSSGRELASVSEQELAEPEDLTCPATSTLITENGRIKVRCTVKGKKRHVHYDEIFSKEWQ